MSREQAVLITLVAYKVVLVLIGIWATRRTKDTRDFFLGGRALGPVVAAVSASASSSSAWTLLAVSGYAYLWGLPALWLFPATLTGFLINWLWIAPRMSRLSRSDGSVTLTEFVAGAKESPLFGVIVKTASLIIVFSFTFYVASQFQAAGNAFANSFGLTPRTSVLIGATIIMIYTLLGGFWAVSVTDTLQGLLMAITAVVLPLVALSAVGGFGDLVSGLAAMDAGRTLSWSGPHGSFLFAFFVLGTLGIGLGYPGQPHVVNRFMALRDDRALRQARVVAIAWAVVVYSGMLLLGLCARLLFAEMANSEDVFLETAKQFLPPVIAGVMLASILSAIMSTADSQLLVAASSVSYDWHLKEGQPANALTRSRIMVVVLSAMAVALVLFVPSTIFSRVLFAWHAVGSAFGPLVIFRVLGFRLKPWAVLATLLTGFGLTVIFHMFENTPGDVVERLVPLILAFGVAAMGISRTPSRVDHGT